MKKTLILGLAVMLMLMLAAGCSSSGNNTSDNQASNTGKENAGQENTGNENAGNTASDKEKFELHVYSFDVNNTETFNEMAKKYEDEHPGVDVVMDFVGGSADWKADLKTRFASGNGPDVFVVDGPSMLNLWKDRIADLSDQPWVEHAVPIARQTATIDGKIYGMPYDIQGFGWVYNKDFFEDAGITETPKTLTELKEAAQKLKDAGHTAFGNGYGEFWILGMHQLNIAFAQQDDPEQFLADLTSGKATIKGNPMFEDYQNLIDLTLEYGNPNPLTVDYTTQENLLGAGEVAIIHQGNFAEGAILKTNPDLNLGLMPVPINDNAEQMDRLEVGLPLLWVVNKESAHASAAKEYLNWLVSSETGKTYLGSKLGKIPAYDNIDTKDPGALGQVVIDYSKAGKTIPWSFNQWPDGSYNKFFAIEQGYIGKQYDYNSMLDKLDAAWQELSKK